MSLQFLSVSRGLASCKQAMRGPPPPHCWWLLLPLRQVVADAQHSEQLATLSRRRSEVRVSALEEMKDDESPQADYRCEYLHAGLIRSGQQSFTNLEFTIYPLRILKIARNLQATKLW